MTAQRDLFGALQPPPLLPGLSFVEDAIPPQGEVDAIAAIDAAPLAPFQFGQWEGKRLTIHYGSAYDFSRHRLDPAPPLPSWLVDLRERLGPKVGLDPAALKAALLIRYDPGAGIGWHRDRPHYPDVVGLSLGAPCVMRLRRRIDGGFERRSLPLPARSLYRLSGEIRWEWEHSIVPLTETRWSITLRTLRDPRPS